MKSQGFILPRAQTAAHPPQPCAYLSASVLSAGAGALLFSAFEGVSPWLALLAPLLCAALLLSARVGKRWGAPLLLVLLAAYCLLLHRAVRAGLLGCANDILRQQTVLTGRIHLPLAGGEAGKRLFALVPGLALLCAWATADARRGRFGFAIVSWLFCVPGLALGFFHSDFGAALLALGIMLQLCPLSKRALPRALAGLALCAALGTALALPLRTGTDSTLLSDLRAALHRIRYDQGGTMPEGQLSDLAPWKKSGETALELTMSAPQKLYLRGFTGEIYTGTSWTPLSGETLAQAADLFYTLHDSDFYAQCQIASVLSLLDLDTTQTVTVQNRAACKKWAYLPYALSDTAPLDPQKIGDTGTSARAQTAVYSYCEGSVPLWYTALSALTEQQNTADAARYLTLEAAYRRFVETQYLQLTPEAAQAARLLLGEDMQGKTLSEIRQAILSCLDRQLTYDETSVTRSGGRDFLTYLQAVSPRGYSVHYATAATLLLRYCGVPARYVEGYFLSSSEAAQCTPGQPYALSEAHAHAWTEYYLDGIGWVPFEVTPGYRDDEEQAPGGAADAKHYENPQLPPPTVEQPEPEPEPQPPASTAAFPRRLALLCAALLLCAAVVLLLVRRMRLRRALRAIQAAPPREAISGYFGYADYLLRRSPLPLPPDGAQAAQLNQKALFSAHEMTQAQKDALHSYVQALLAQYRKRNLFRRLYDRVVLCLY